MKGRKKSYLAEAIAGPIYCVLLRNLTIMTIKKANTRLTSYFWTVSQWGQSLFVFALKIFYTYHSNFTRYFIYRKRAIISRGLSV